MTAYFDEWDRALGLHRKVIEEDTDRLGDFSRACDAVREAECKLVWDVLLACESPGFPEDLRVRAYEVILEHAVEARPLNDATHPTVDDQEGVFRELGWLSNKLHTVFHDLAMRQIWGFSDSPLSPLRVLHTRGEERLEEMVKAKRSGASAQEPAVTVKRSGASAREPTEEAKRSGASARESTEKEEPMSDAVNYRTGDAVNYRTGDADNFIHALRVGVELAEKAREKQEVEKRKIEVILARVAEAIATVAPLTAEHVWRVAFKAEHDAATGTTPSYLLAEVVGISDGLVYRSAILAECEYDVGRYPIMICGVSAQDATHLERRLTELVLPDPEVVERILAVVTS